MGAFPHRNPTPKEATFYNALVTWVGERMNLERLRVKLFWWTQVLGPLRVIVFVGPMIGR
jgi:hypothetical protein